MSIPSNILVTVGVRCVQVFTLQLVELVGHQIILVKKLLLIPLKLADLLLFTIVVRLKLLHELLVRFQKSRILDEVGELVGLLILRVRVVRRGCVCLRGRIVQVIS